MNSERCRIARDGAVKQLAWGESRLRGFWIETLGCSLLFGADPSAEGCVVNDQVANDRGPDLDSRQDPSDAFMLELIRGSVHEIA